MFEGTFAVLNIDGYTLRSVGPSFFTLFASGEAGCITSSPEGAGTSSQDSYTPAKSIRPPERG